MKKSVDRDRRVMIEDYRHLPGEHCGSVAMRNLLFHYCAIDLPEAVIFGLGSGIDLLFLHSPEIDPPIVVFGRSLTMEQDVAAALGIGYLEAPELDDDKAWADVRAEVASGRPTMLTGDVFYLDSYSHLQIHFPAHRFVIVGYDEDSEQAYLAERIDRRPRRCAFGSLAASRNPPEGISTYNTWGRFTGTEATRSREEACERALRTSASRMLGDDGSQLTLIQLLGSGKKFEAATGLAGIARFREQVATIDSHADASRIASYAASCIEKFGNGGGNFRTFYALFLDWARKIRPDLVDAELPQLARWSASRWTELHRVLQQVAEAVERAALNRATQLLEEIEREERSLFTAVRSSVG